MELVCYSLLIGVRLTALIWSAPLLGHQAVPVWVRLGLAGILTLGTVFVGIPPELPPGALSNGLLGHLLTEALIGLLLGLSISLLLAAGEIMGEVISQMAGVAPGEPDETGDALSPATRLIGLLTIVLFILARGPEHLVGGILESFRALPPGSAWKQSALLPLLGELVRQGIGLAIRGIGPAVAALLTASAAVHLFQRVLPGSGLGGIGPSLGMFAFAVAMFLTVSGGLWLVDGHWEEGWQMVRQTLQATASPLPPSNLSFHPAGP